VLAAFRAEPQVARAVRDAAAARSEWLGIAAACFLSAALASAAAWWSALRACSGRLGYLETASRYAVGGLVNTFVPARLGDAVRVGLLSRAFEERGRVLTTTGVLAFLGVARAAALMLLVLPAAAAGMLPIRWLAFPGGLAVCAVAVAVGARRRSARRLVVSVPRRLPLDRRFAFTGGGRSSAGSF